MIAPGKFLRRLVRQGLHGILSIFEEKIDGSRNKNSDPY